MESWFLIEISRGVRPFISVRERRLEIPIGIAKTELMAIVPIVPIAITQAAIMARRILRNGARHGNVDPSLGF